MSGKPEPTKIGNVRRSLVREAEIEDRRREIAIELQRLAEEQTSLAEELRTLRTERWKAMTSMDLTASGNYGYEARVDVFLMELVKPVQQAAE